MILRMSAVTRWPSLPRKGCLLVKTQAISLTMAKWDLYDAQQVLTFVKKMQLLHKMGIDEKFHT